MFQDIPEPILRRMRLLEEMDSKDRLDGTPRMQRLRQVPPETGRLIALVAANSPSGKIIEIGTSAGYSTLWLCLATRALGRNVTTYEVLPEKIALAQETFREGEVEDVVELVAGDAREYLTSISEIAFCFLDAEKEHYQACYDLVIPKLVAGGVLLADNVVSHKKDLQPLVDFAFCDERVDTLVVPIGKGILYCRRA